MFKTFVTYGCETWCLTAQEDERRILRKIYAPVLELDEHQTEWTNKIRSHSQIYRRSKHQMARSHIRSGLLQKRQEPRIMETNGNQRHESIQEGMNVEGHLREMVLRQWQRVAEDRKIQSKTVKMAKTYQGLQRPMKKKKIGLALVYIKLFL